MSKKQNMNRVNKVSVTSLDYYTIIKDLIHNFWVILLAGAIAYMAVTVTLQMLHKPLYTSTATLMVAGTANNYNSFSTYSSDAERFSKILTDEYVLQEVAESLGMTHLDAEVTSTVVADTNLLNLTVVASNPTMAFKIARGIMEHYKDISTLMYPTYTLLELSPVTYPTESSNGIEASPLTKKCVLAAMLGMAALIAVCSSLYDNIKNYKDADQKLDTKVYGVIYHEKKRRKFLSLRRNKKAVLVTDPIVSTGFVESYKHLRERLIGRTRNSKKNVILVTSMLENEGKSTVAANLALSLSSVSERRVLLIDGDLRKPAVHKIFSLQEDEYVNYTKYLLGEVSANQCIYSVKDKNLDLLVETNGSSKSTEIIDTPPMETLIKALREVYDYIIIDTPPLAQVSDAEAIARFADYSLLVLAPDNSKTDLINDCIADLDACNAKLLGCVLNNVNTVSRWIYQHFRIDVSGLIKTDVNDYSASYTSSHTYGGYGYGDISDKYREKQKKKAKHVEVHEIETSDSFFNVPAPAELKEEAEDELPVASETEALDEEVQDE